MNENDVINISHEICRIIKTNFEMFGYNTLIQDSDNYDKEAHNFEAFYDSLLYDIKKLLRIKSQTMYIYKSTLVDKESFMTFINQMLKILGQKYDKYKDSWKEIALGNLKWKLNDMAYRTHVYIPEATPKRKLVHIANYCYFLYTRLLKKESEKNNEKQ